MTVGKRGRGAVHGHGGVAKAVTNRDGIVWSVPIAVIRSLSAEGGAAFVRTGESLLFRDHDLIGGALDFRVEDAVEALVHRVAEAKRPGRRGVAHRRVDVRRAQEDIRNLAEVRKDDAIGNGPRRLPMEPIVRKNLRVTAGPGKLIVVIGRILHEPQADLLQVVQATWSPTPGRAPWTTRATASWRESQ